MIDHLDFSKVSNSHITPLDFDVIIQAVGGDVACIKMIIDQIGRASCRERV